MKDTQNNSLDQKQKKINKTCYYLGIKEKDRKKILDQVISRFKNSSFSIHEGVIALSIKMLCSNGLFIEGSIIHKKILGWIEQINSDLEKLSSLFFDFTIINMDDDFIGSFYQSIQQTELKKINGIYYTPPELLTHINIENNKKVIDPCCGSGGILLRVLNKKHDPKLVYARDIDVIALQICSINLVLFFNDPNMQANINYQNLILESVKKNEFFDYIITNPPWGGKNSKENRKKLLDLYPNLATTETFSIALYQSMKMLSNQGKLYIFLPYSFLNVAIHKNIRKNIISSGGQIEITLLGNAFRGVLSEAILLVLKKYETDIQQEEIKIKDKSGKQLMINKSEVVEPNYIITATSSKIDDIILNKVFSVEHSTLLGNTDFVLGIVTGNNKRHILKNKTNISEPIYRGKDIFPYKCSKAECFIEFCPEFYQQVAPLKYFRMKKIIYRFISNKLICMLDNNNSLMLNSANAFISHSYPMETIVCLFNSCIYTFIYRKKFHSNKVLKTHIQSMPLPNFPKEKHIRFMELYHNLIQSNGKIDYDYQKDINLEICQYFGLLVKEYLYISNCLTNNNVIFKTK